MGQCAGKEAARSTTHLSIKQRDQLLIEFKDISAELVPEKMIARTIDAILNLLPVERASVFIVDRAAGVLRTFNEIDVGGSPHNSMRAEGDDGAPMIKTITIPIDSGIVGSVVQNAENVIVKDAPSDPRFDSSVDKKTGFKTRNLLSVPVKLSRQAVEEVDRSSLRRSKTKAKLTQEQPARKSEYVRKSAWESHGTKEEVVAVLQALNHDGNFGKHDISVLEFIAMLLAGVLARSALVDEATKEKSKATALLKVAETVNSPEATIRMKALRVMQAVCLAIDCERASFVLVDEVHAEQVLFSLDVGTAGLRFPTSAGVTGACICSAAPIHILDAYADERFNKDADTKTGFVTRDIVAVPVIRHGSGGVGGKSRVIGVIEGINSRRGRFEEEHINVLQTIALQVADRLMPELIQDMVEASSDDHGLEGAEVERVKSLLAAEFATPKQNNKLRKVASHVTDVIKVGRASEVNGSSRQDDGGGSASSGGPVSFKPGKSGGGVGAPGAPSAPGWLGDMLGTHQPGGGPGLAAVGAGGLPSLPVLSESALMRRPRGMTEEQLIHWDVNILQFDASELMQLAAAVFKQSGVLEHFGIPVETLAHFLAAVGGRYHANPYHNWNHGVHVLLGSWLLAREELRHRGSKGSSDLGETSVSIAGFSDVESLEPLHILALLIAAVGHDVDHPGVNNAFLCASNDVLAMRYNDLSVLENHHAATTFEILAHPSCNMLRTITFEQRKEVRSLMIAAILATDMAHHQAMVKELTQQASDQTTTVPPAFTLRVLCHVADLGNCAISWPLSKEWAVRVCDEAINQAKREEALGLPCGKLTPYTDEELTARQLIFVDGWIQPLFKAAAILYPGVKGRLGAINECREGCKVVTTKKASRLSEEEA